LIPKTAPPALRSVPALRSFFRRSHCRDVFGDLCAYVKGAATGDQALMDTAAGAMND